MRADSAIKRDVEELAYDAALASTDIDVSVNDGVVPVTGIVHSFIKRSQADADAKRVSGALGVANDIQVRLPSSDARPDPDLARDVLSELKAELPFWYEQIRSTVRDGIVTRATALTRIPSIWIVDVHL